MLLVRKFNLHILSMLCCLYVSSLITFFKIIFKPVARICWTFKQEIILKGILFHRDMSLTEISSLFLYLGFYKPPTQHINAKLSSIQGNELVKIKCKWICTVLDLLYRAGAETYPRNVLSPQSFPVSY